MSFQGTGEDISGLSAASFAASQFYIVKVDTSGNIAIAGAGDIAIGVLQNKPQAASRGCTVRYLGISKVICGSAAVTVGDRIASDASGKAKTAVAGKVNTSDTGAAADALLGSYVLGIALASAVSGDVFPVLITHSGSVPTTVS